jgi:formylglycine-generating enzyme required for sulfatase activity
MKLSVAGLADLARAALQDAPDAVARLAELLGYEPAPQPAIGRSQGLAGQVGQALKIETAPDRPEAFAPLAQLPFWRLEDIEFRPPLPPPPTEPQRRVALAPVHWHGRPSESVRIQPLASWRELLPRLRAVLARHTETRAVDLAVVVDRLCRGEVLLRLPRQERRHWGDRIQIVLDRSDRLIPYWLDQLDICLRLQGLYSRHAVELVVFREGSYPLTTLDPSGEERDYRFPPPGTTVLVLGDLGSLDHRGPGLSHYWTQIGRHLSDLGGYPVALSPCPRQRWAAGVERYWHLVDWETPSRCERSCGGVNADWQARTHRLLRLVSPAVRIEPGLLRAVRLLLPPGEADAALEADAWQHPALTSASCVAATMDPAQANQFRSQFAHEPIELRRRVLAEIRNWRARLAPEVWFIELLGLDSGSQGLLPHRDREDAEHFVRWLEQRIAADDEAGEPADCEEAFFCRVEPRLELSRRTDDPLRRDWHSIWRRVHRNQSRLTAPLDYDPREASSADMEERVFQVLQRGASIEFQGPPTPPRVGLAVEGSPLGYVRSRNREVLVAPLRKDDFWRDGTPPAWAVDWGEDEFGRWVAFEFDGVRQRMRWIEPGTFRMGSPEDEPGRYGEGSDRNEGPQHEVTISRGFWLFDTACTQALWQAVMGHNPSRFPSPDRLVEYVGWEDCQRFLTQINERVPGLDLCLPTEAQWEYACRAGTETAFSLGDNITPAQVNYDGNYPYKGGAKGLYRQQTVAVASLPPNPWGLYEIHGNVYEWCHDGRRTYERASVTDPVGPTAGGAERALRGGSWDGLARHVRCAGRFALHPGSRSDIIGFRPARVPHSPGQGAAQTVAEPAGPALGRKSGARLASESSPKRQREGSTAHEEPSGAQLVRLSASGVHVAASVPDAQPDLGQTGPRAPVHRGCVIPPAHTFVIATDCERLTYRQLTQPPWASAIGRDRFGLWVEFEVPAKKGKPVTQRMRWIGPGRFPMGSPDDEPGRVGPSEAGTYWRDEGPQHLVTITQGYWLFDTPCTQALWEAVMGENPSRFRSPDRPVDSVTWEDCLKFLETANQRLPGPSLVLPTEAQWEYACRAGTETATYAGPLKILGECNAPALDAIAWYTGNSGVGFELEYGYDSSGWLNKQYDQQRAGSHPVANKSPNPWGLYDMLGNVWEWCLDKPRQYTKDPMSDPGGADDGGAERALRGGGWRSLARDVRCAARYTSRGRYDGIGFRPARVQQSQVPVSDNREAPASGSAEAEVSEQTGTGLGRKGAARSTPDLGNERTRRGRKREK